MSTKETHKDVLRVAFPAKSLASSYEPTRIHYAYEYAFLENIYSPLVDLSNDKGVPISSVSREHYWESNKLHFVIRDNLKTIDGYPITVEDVIFSLKRVIILSENTHGNFKELVCPDINLKTIEDDCPNIMTKDNTLILNLESKKDFLVPMLSSIDFSIIPRGSVDSKTLKIVDYRNTSGPYYVDSDMGNGNIVLKANPNHFHFTPKMASEVRLFPTRDLNTSDVINLFNQGKVDFITTTEALTLDDLHSVDVNNVNYHETIYIRTKKASITEKGKKKLSLNQRLAFSKSLQKSFHDEFKDKEGYRPSFQFFLSISEGGLLKKEDNILKKTMEPIEMNKSGEGIYLGLSISSANTVEKYKRIAKTYMPDLKVERIKGSVAFERLNDKDLPDYSIVSTDSGFLEDIGLLSYSMNSGSFGFSKKEGQAWLKNYMAIEDREERIKVLKKMHLNALTHGFLVPLISSPYIAVARKPWKPQLSELFANCPLWKIRKY